MKAADLIGEFKKHGLGPYIEVPCSYLGPLIDGLMKDDECEVLNPVNEAIAMGIAAGSYLASERIPVVLMQNSGLCNSLNAITSLHMIYRVSALCLVTWRGQPGIGDAPEHYVMGEKVEALVDALEVPYDVLEESRYRDQIASLVGAISASRGPGVVLITKGLIDKETGQARAVKPRTTLTRTDAVATIVRIVGTEACYVATNGHISREAHHALRAERLGDIPCFCMLGSMGHALPIALGIERHIRDGRKVIALDGDGGCLMHLGAMASVASGDLKATGLMHVVLDNGAYGSTGGQPTVSDSIDLPVVAQGCGYVRGLEVSDAKSLSEAVAGLVHEPGPSLLRVRIEDTGEEVKPRVSEGYSCKTLRETFSAAFRRWA